MQTINVTKEMLNRINKERNDGRILTKMRLTFDSGVDVTDAMILEAVSSYATVVSAKDFVSKPPHTGMQKRKLV